MFNFFLSFSALVFRFWEESLSSCFGGSDHSYIMMNAFRAMGLFLKFDHDDFYVLCFDFND